MYICNGKGPFSDFCLLFSDFIFIILVSKFFKFLSDYCLSFSDFVYYFMIFISVIIIFLSDILNYFIFCLFFLLP